MNLPRPERVWELALVWAVVASFLLGLVLGVLLGWLWHPWLR